MLLFWIERWVFCEKPGTKPRCPLRHSWAFLFTFFFVIKLVFVVDRPKERNHFALLSPTDVFVQCGGDSLFFCAMTANLLSLFQKPVVNSQICSHVFAL